MNEEIKIIVKDNLKESAKEDSLEDKLNKHGQLEDEGACEDDEI